MKLHVILVFFLFLSYESAVGGESLPFDIVSDTSKVSSWFRDDCPSKFPRDVCLEHCGSSKEYMKVLDVRSAVDLLTELDVQKPQEPQEEVNFREYLEIAKQAAESGSCCHALRFLRLAGSQMRRPGYRFFLVSARILGNCQMWEEGLLTLGEAMALNPNSTTLLADYDTMLESSGRREPPLLISDLTVVDLDKAGRKLNRLKDPGDLGGADVYPLPYHAKVRGKRSEYEFYGYYATIPNAYVDEDIVLDAKYVYSQSAGCQSSTSGLEDRTLRLVADGLVDTSLPRAQKLSEILRVRPYDAMPIDCEEMEGRTISGRPIHRIEGTVVNLAQKWGHNYYVMLVEVLPRLMQVLEEVQDKPSVKILVRTPSQSPQSLFGILNYIGVSSSQVVQLQPGVLYAADRVITPAMVPCGGVVPELSVKLRTELVRGGLFPWAHSQNRTLLSLPLRDWRKKHADPAPNEIVVISRAKETERAFVNHEDFVLALQRWIKERNREVGANDTVATYDFKPGVLVESVASIFSRAKAVFGPHGAGMASMMFAPPQTIIFELMMMQEDLVFMDLSAANYFNHAQIKMKSAESRDTEFRTRNVIRLGAEVYKVLYGEYPPSWIRLTTATHSHGVSV